MFSLGHLRGPLSGLRARSSRVFQYRSLTIVNTSRRFLSASSASSKDEYDCCVIGCGPAGFAATSRAHDKGKKVCVIEKSALGGASVHDGVFSSKMMWEMSHESRLVKDHVPSYRDDYLEMVEKIRRAQNTKVDQMSFQLDLLSKVDLKLGKAEFISPHEVVVTKPNGETELIKSKNFVIATGSYPRIHGDFPYDRETFITSDDIMTLKDFPKDLLIVGGGVIGCEFATIFSNFGHTKVHLLNERRPRLLPFEDKDLSTLIEHNLEAVSATVHNDVVLNDIVKLPNGRVRASIDKNGEGMEIEVEKVLFAIGRIPAIDDLGIEKAGISKCDRGGVKVDNRHGQSLDQPHIYVAGDASADVGLVNVAEMEGRLAVEHMFCPDGKASEELNYDNLSSIMFLEPEVACIGLNETEAARRGIKYISGSYGYDLVNRALITSGTRRKMGYVKLVVSEDDKMRLLGVRAVGPEASAVIECASLILHEGRPLADLQKFVRPHPSISEAVQECVRAIQGTSIYKPEAFPKSIRISCSKDGLRILEGSLGDSHPHRPLIPTYLDLHD